MKLKIHRQSYIDTEIRWLFSSMWNTSFCSHSYFLHSLVEMGPSNHIMPENESNKSKPINYGTDLALHSNL